MTPAERELVRRQVVASRRRQGRSDSVEDADLLDRLAARLLADVRREHNDAPGTRGPGRRDHPAAAKTKRGRSNANP
jgi:hypothetical protein